MSIVSNVAKKSNKVGIETNLGFREYVIDDPEYCRNPFI